jgi:hypothetical protein
MVAAQRSSRITGRSELSSTLIPKSQASTFAGIRSVILSKKARTKPSDFMVIVKPTPEASYKNTIQIFDEMNINAVKRYALVDIDPGEFTWIRSRE